MINDAAVSFPRSKIKFLLLEGVHAQAVNRLTERGYAVEQISTSISHEELLEKIKDIHVLGLRSKTQVTAAHFAAAKRLLSVGCFGVGTNQVDLNAAREAGVPVFNAPYGNTRSVAELTLAMIFSLARDLGDHNKRMHAGRWKKTAKNSFEVKGKVLGIVGYGHIGQQIGLLAEGVGMEVVFYDKAPRLALGRSQIAPSFEALLSQSDFVTLHIPASAGGKPLMNKETLSHMKKGGFLLNLSRGDLVDLEALREVILDGALGGAGIDVYSKEPKSNDEQFETPLAGLPRVILAPHQGGSTEEAQEKIAHEVTDKFIKFMDEGTSVGAVNFPQIDLPPFPDSHRLLNIHKNVPGALSKINAAIAQCGANINAQYLNTFNDIGYLIVDVNQDVSENVSLALKGLEDTIKIRVLF
jgi:D-3-phosphoglycerate dehydrogenase / 2-oxoglutarate reductase